MTFKMVVEPKTLFLYTLKIIIMSKKNVDCYSKAKINFLQTDP